MYARMLEHASTNILKRFPTNCVLLDDWPWGFMEGSWFPAAHNPQISEVAAVNAGRWVGRLSYPKSKFFAGWTLMKHVDVQGFLVELLYLTGFIENALMAELQRCVGMQYEKVPWAVGACCPL